MKLIVYIQTGCGACEEYLPRLRRIVYAQKYTRERPAPTLAVINLTTPFGMREAVKHSVSATPTTDVFSDHNTIRRYKGALPDVEIERLLLR